MIKIDKIKNVIAIDTWTFPTKAGKSVSSKIMIGRPFVIPDDKDRNWVCPVSIEHFTTGILPAYGVGPVDSLMNAMTLVRAFFEIKEEGAPKKGFIQLTKIKRSQQSASAGVDDAPPAER